MAKRWAEKESSLEEMCNSARTQSEIISYRGGFWTGFQETNKFCQVERNMEGHFRTSEILPYTALILLERNTRDINFLESVWFSVN